MSEYHSIYIVAGKGWGAPHTQRLQQNIPGLSDPRTLARTECNLHSPKDTDIGIDTDTGTDPDTITNTILRRRHQSGTRGTLALAGKCSHDR